MSRLAGSNTINLIGAVIIVVGYIVCTVVVVSRTLEERPIALGERSAGRSVVIMHWQLEPGYREAMQAVIDDYNALPHVQAAGVRVRQLAVTERVYAQILNVHVLSGTAPDLCAKGMSQMDRGAEMAQYFEALGDHADRPNPYHAAEYFDGSLTRDELESLAEMPWRESLIDGMKGGWSDALQDYYAVPTSFVGGTKIYYNRTLVAEAKALLRDAASQPERPRWYEALFLRRTAEGAVEGYVTEGRDLQAWLSDDSRPDTLGRLFMLAAAIRELAARENNTDLVAIAGSAYSVGLFTKHYLVPFTSSYADVLDLNGDSSATAVETWIGWKAGHWSFSDPAVVAYYECMRKVCELFPPGFLGLDREQARRRFVAGDAAMISSGLWDARSLMDTVEGRVLAPGEPDPSGVRVSVVEGQRRAGYRFSLGIMDFPLPGPGERWSEWISYPASEARASPGVPYMVYHRSPNKDWAIDFLRYLTSRPVNERFNQQAGWLPIALHARPAPWLDAFVPNVRGLPPGARIEPSHRAGNLRTLFEGHMKNYLAGDLDYDEFVAGVIDVVDDPRNGINRLVFNSDRSKRDEVRNVAQLMQAMRARQMLDTGNAEGTRDADDAYRRVARRMALLHNGVVPRLEWSQALPDEPFPSF